MCDIIDAGFIGDRDANGLPLPFRLGRIPKMTNNCFEESLAPPKLEGCMGTAEDEWMFRQALHRGSLVAKGCQISAILAKKPLEVQRNCFELGKYFYLTWQAFIDMKPFKKDITTNDFKLNLISAPVLFHLTHDPSLYDKIFHESKTLDGVDHDSLFHTIKNGPGIAQTEKLMKKLKKKTQNELGNFPSSDKRQKIENILKDF